MRTVLTLLTCAATAVACQAGAGGGAAAGGTAAPPNCSVATPPQGDPAQSANHAAFLKYAHGLAYEAASAPTGERRPLTRKVSDNPPTFRLGPTGSIQPQSCANQNTKHDLQAGQGRIIAMFVLDSAYDKLNLPADTSYLWVDNLNTAGNKARGVIIPGNGNENPVEVAVRVEFHEHFSHGFAEARWGFDPNDDYAWSSCAKTGCCYIESGQPQPGDTIP